MPGQAYSVCRVDGLRQSTRRAVALLCAHGNRKVNAEEKFRRLKPNPKRALMVRMDYWISGGTHDGYFHGWPNDLRYKDCFVFKWKENRTNQRMYGFVCNPADSNPRFQLCVLAIHATKTDHETDRSELDRIVELMADGDVMAAVRHSFSDGEGDGVCPN